MSNLNEKLYALSKDEVQNERFFMEQNGDASLYWRSYNPDSNSGGQIVEQFISVRDIKKAFEETEKNPENFWDFLCSHSRTYLYDCDQSEFTAAAEEFMKEPNFVGCTDGTKAVLKKLVEMEQLMTTLNGASDAYYGNRDETMSNYEWNAMFDRLMALEVETRIVFKESPTQKVSDSTDDIAGRKEAHEFPALSLAKSKKIEDLQKWAEDKPIWLGWKLDGLTLVVTYDNGKLSKIVTRGDGHIGTNISYMAGYIAGIPLKIKHKGHLVVRGEAVISNEDFLAINEMMEEPYSNPRNLASGTLALKEDEVALVKERHVTFVPFTLVHIEDESFDTNSWGARMDFLKTLGFSPVEHVATSCDGLPAQVDAFTKKLQGGKCKYPVDGLVICYDDVAYSQTGSVTGHHATRGGFAFKWPDVAATTTLRDIEWSCAASVITPVAIFDPVELEGTTVSRASLVNISELKRLGIGRPNETNLSVIKANMIIPKVIKAQTAGAAANIPTVCPVCGKPTRINVSASGAETLVCTNADCAAKQLMKFVRFVSKEGLDVDGLSIKTLELLINAGLLKRQDDIFKLNSHADEISRLPGMGKRSCEKLLSSIEKARKVPAVRFIKALSIPMIGRDAAKRIFDAIGYEGFIDRISNWKHFDDIEGIGPEKDKAIQDWFAEYENGDLFDCLRNALDIENHPAKSGVSEGRCAGLVFVITGDVHSFKNRNEFKAYVESQGGKVSGSVSRNTNFLVNNDITSVSSKNKKAKDLNVPIITEDTFVEKFGK